MIHREPGREWSGVVFYTISDLSRLMETGIDVEVHDFFPLDIGTVASTSPAFDERILDILEKYPALEEMKMGALHSHNSMSAYFSNVDNDDLADNTKCYRHYLSMVINNRLDVVARLAFNVKSTTQYKLITDPTDADGITYGLDGGTREVDMVGYIDLKAEFPEATPVQDEYATLCDDLLKPKPRPVPTLPATSGYMQPTRKYNDLFTEPANPFYTVLESLIRGGSAYSEKMNSDYERDPTMFLSSYSLTSLNNLLEEGKANVFYNRMSELYKNFEIICRPYLRYENPDYTYVHDEFYFIRELAEVALGIATEIRDNKYPKYEHAKIAVEELNKLAEILENFEFEDTYTTLNTPYNGYMED